ncbi:MAG: YceD family protein [Cyanobacteria bacterium]|nr:YceD family protein [Cyanobacteriota bacterium]MDA0866743.1 YceD family protein [Cyanobacteriota bacterium]
MKAIYVPHLLNAVHQTRLLSFETHLSALETLVPIRGELSVSHCKTYIEVKGKADTIVTLTCDRCLQCYNHRLSLDTSELIWLEETAVAEQEPLEREVGVEELVETLSPHGYFEPDTWLYEQLCLALPQRQICDADCQGIAIEEAPAQSSSSPVDHRWAALAALQRQLPDAQP